MDYLEFYEQMKKGRLIPNHWGNLLNLLSDEISGSANYDSAMKLFVLYFSLVDKGNTYMLLDNETTRDQFEEIINQQRITAAEEVDNPALKSDNLKDIEISLDAVSSEIKKLPIEENILTGLSVIGDKKLFILHDRRLFARKYYHAVKNIKESAIRLFPSPAFPTDTPLGHYTEVTSSSFSLKDGQKQVITKGLGANLLVTGGPGTGKTTSVFFLLLALLLNDGAKTIYLTAPSGKAAARMRESIHEEKDHLCKEFLDTHTSIIEKILSAEGQTIHRLLKYDHDTKGFLYHKGNQFPKNSIFVIDEASMIDVCLFASLLEAIPTGARVFILGDKNQLPSVECGAVYAELIDQFQDNVIELSETNRFSNKSEIFTLSEKINHGKELDLSDEDFVSISDFTIANNDSELQFYNDFQDSNKVIIEKVTGAWYHRYYSEYQSRCTDIDDNSETAAKLADIYQQSEKTKILCALRNTTRGAEHINKLILENHYRGKRISGFYPGELLMITKNLNSLDLYNGDCGVTVKFSGDDNLYFMIKRTETENLRPADEKRENQIFRLGEFFFYPVRMIGLEDITSAFAITVHKAQGSGYDDVFVILPKTEKHPLLNRQLIYTAITRTKKHAYVISNRVNLDYSSKNSLTRYTGLRADEFSAKAGKPRMDI